MAIPAAHLNRESLNDLLTEACSPQRFQSRNQLAQVCGFPPSALSNALRFDRGLSDAVEGCLLEQTGWSRGSLYIPEPVPPEHLQKAALMAEVKRLREQVSELLLAGTDRIAEAVREIGD